MAYSLQAINQAYYDNADWGLTSPINETKARAFFVACVRILGLSPQRLQEQTGEIELPDRRFVAQQLEEVKLALKRRNWDSSRLIDLVDFRGRD